MKQLLKILLIAISLFYYSCKKDNQISETLFSSPVGTMWTYVSSLSNDTIIWELTGQNEINGEGVIELTIAQRMGTSKFLYKQEEGKIYCYGKYLQKANFNYPSKPEYTDTLFIFSEPSLEYVLDEEIGYNWHKKILTRSSEGYAEAEIYMEIIGYEQIETPSGNYQCFVIQDEVDNLYSVSEPGLIQISTTIPIADSAMTFYITLIEKN